MSMPDVFIGVDISKAYLDLYRSDRDRHWRVANRAEAIASLVGELPPGCRVFFEATGGLDRPLACARATGEVRRQGARGDGGSGDAMELQTRSSPLDAIFPVILNNSDKTEPT